MIVWDLHTFKDFNMVKSPMDASSAVQCSAVRVGGRISLILSIVYLLGRNC